MSASDGPARTVFFGSGRFAVPILDALVAAPEVDVVGVVSAPDRPSGRGHSPSATPVAARAGELGLTLLRPERIRDPATISAIADLRPGSGHPGRLRPDRAARRSSTCRRAGILNVHPSLLPRHRGAAPIPATILAGDPTTGVTLIRMDAGLDTGPIVAVEDWRARRDGDGAGARSAGGAGRCPTRHALARRLARGFAASPTQDDAAATMTRPLRREDGRLDPLRTAAELARQVRALPAVARESSRHGARPAHRLARHGERTGRRG